MMILLTVLLGGYVGMVLLWVIGWQRLRTHTLPEEEAISSDEMVTVVIALRNEQAHIPALTEDLSRQRYSDFDVIFVDDHSEDDTWTLLQTCCQGHARWQCLPAGRAAGKKAALRQGIARAKEGLILCTDADCRLPATWVATQVRARHHFHADLLIGPVRLHTPQALQALEYLSLQAVTGGSAGIGMPVLCGGANLAFTKVAYTQSVADLHDEIASGDDIFLLAALKKRKGTIAFVADERATVEALGSHSLREFLQQRSRWAGKAKGYTDAGMVLSAALVLTAQVTWVAACVLVGWHPMWATALLVAKMAADFRLLLPAARFYQQTALLKYFLPTSLLYPGYVGIVLLYHALHPTAWKGRTIKP